MAFFNTRFPAQSDARDPAASADSVEALRQRAKHRLIGAVVLVGLGVIGFPLLFDTQPRPVAVDIPISIPDKNKAKPLVPPAPAAANGRVSASASLAPYEQVVTDKGAVKPSEAKAKADTPVAKKEVVPSPKSLAAEPKPKPDTKADAKPRPDAKPDTKAKVDDGARARALLAGDDKDNADRFVVQIGAFADATKARETRLRVEAAGLKTYTHVAETADGRRIRVRVGPYSSKAEADQAAKKIKSIGLSAAILTL